MPTTPGCKEFEEWFSQANELVDASAIDQIEIAFLAGRLSRQKQDVKLCNEIAMMEEWPQSDMSDSERCATKIEETP